jgi:hypothetical protein
MDILQAETGDDSSTTLVEEAVNDDESLNSGDNSESLNAEDDNDDDESLYSLSGDDDASTATSNSYAGSGDGRWVETNGGIKYTETPQAETPKAVEFSSANQICCALRDNTATASLYMGCDTTFEESGYEEMTSCFEANRSLETFQISGCGHNHDGRFRRVIQHLSPISSLTSLSLKGIVIDLPVARALRRCLGSPTSQLQNLTLDPKVTEADAAGSWSEIFQGLSQNDTVLTLKLNSDSHSTVVGRAGTAISSYIRSTSTLKELGITSRMGSATFAGLVDSLVRNQSVTSLKLTGLPKECGARLRRLLHEKRNIQELKLEPLEQDDVNQIARGLQGYQTLDHLDLKGRYGIEPKPDMALLVEAIEECKTQSTLILERLRGVNLLVPFLRSPNCALTELSLEACDLDDNIVAAVLSALEENRTVTTLKLKGDYHQHFGTAACQALISSLPGISCVESLSIMCFDGSCGALIPGVMESLKKNRSLVEVDIFGAHCMSFFNYDAKKTISFYCMKNKFLALLENAPAIDWPNILKSIPTENRKGRTVLFLATQRCLLPR